MIQKWWHQFERGQALVEYWPTIPIAIMISVMASGITSWLTEAYTETIEALNPGLVCDTNLTEDMYGPTVTHPGGHMIELVGVNYNPNDNTTSVVYRVHSITNPSISHWVLGLPKAVADNILQISAGEEWEWTNSDPWTGAMGIKFDTGYESPGGGGPPAGGPGGGPPAGGPGGGPPAGGPGGGPPGGGPPGKSGSNFEGISLASLGSSRSFSRVYAPSQESGSTTYETGLLSDARDIAMLLSGQFQFHTTVVTVKSGLQTTQGAITAPYMLVDGSADAEGCD